MTVKQPTLGQSFLPILFLIVVLVLNVTFFGDNASSGPNQIGLLLSAAVAALLAYRLGHGWEHVLKGILKSINTAMPSILILLLIGALAGTWLISGIVPAMIYYGLQLLSPKIFLFAACLVCMIVSLATGSSWSTAATVGIALMSTGEVLGINPAIVAGAVISGAYFGDKMSPLSDTTNLAPAMAGTDLFTHIRYMMITTIPSIVIALIIFLVIGLSTEATASAESIQIVSEAILSKFYISPLLFIVPVIVIVMIARKVPAVPALLVGVLLGGVAAVIFQSGADKDIITPVADLTALFESSPKLLEWGWNESNMIACYVANMKAMFGDIAVHTGIESVDILLSNGGMYGMMNVIWLVITAMIFGGIMEVGGFLQRIVTMIIGKVESATSLVARTVGTCVFFNLTASEQYVAIVIPGRMFADVYDKKGIAPEVLSRTLEDSGTVTSVLVPWNSCGAYHAGTLKIDTWAYLPYCFFNLISPIMTVLVTAIGYKIRRKPSPTK